MDCWRGICARKAKQLSTTDTLEKNPLPETAEAALDTESSHEGHEHHEHDHHGHEGHDHDHSHQHGPVLNPECTRELVIDVPADEVAKSYGKVVGNYRKYAKIPGFRAGKVPESVIKRRFATEIRKEVIDGLLPQRFNKAVAELGVKPVGQPQVTELTVEDGAPLHVKAVFEYVPAFSIEGYKDVTVPKPPVEITDEEFKAELAQLRESRATVEPVEEDRTLVDGDWAQITYKGQVEGDKTAAPISGEDTLVEIGGKDTVEAFSAALRGARSGQELKAEVIYPADYSEARLAGKTVAYDVEVKAIKKRTLPELDDDFAKELGAYESYADLEERVREHLASRKRRSVEGETKDRLFAALTEKYPFPIPESLVQEQIDARLERGLRALAAQGMDTEQMRKLDFQRLRAAQRDSASAEVKTFILLDRIAQEENITVSDEEMDHELQLAALQSREPVDALKVRLTEDGGLARIREQLRREKTASVMYERLPA
jgi:trigger factor